MNIYSLIVKEKPWACSRPAATPAVLLQPFSRFCFLSFVFHSPFLLLHYDLCLSSSASLSLYTLPRTRNSTRNSWKYILRERNLPTVLLVFPWNFAYTCICILLSRVSMWQQTFRRSNHPSTHAFILRIRIISFRNLPREGDPTKKLINFHVSSSLK